MHFFKTISLKKQLPLVALEDFILKKAKITERTEMNCPFQHGIFCSSYKISLWSTNGIKNCMPRTSSLNLQLHWISSPQEQNSSLFLGSQTWHKENPEFWEMKTKILTSCIMKEWWERHLKFGALLLLRDVPKVKYLREWQVTGGGIIIVNNKIWSSSNNK